MTVVNCAVEGDLDGVVARRLLREAGLCCGIVYGGKGKGHIRAKIGSYAHAARHTAWFVLVDLDDEAPCAAALIAAWLDDAPPLMRFRIAVREVEAWLLADRSNLSRYLAVSINRIPRAIEELPDPKGSLVDIARNSRSRRNVRVCLHVAAAGDRSGRYT